MIFDKNGMFVEREYLENLKSLKQISPKDKLQALFKKLIYQVLTFIATF